jgi:hypothetical protein
MTQSMFLHITAMKMSEITRYALQSCLLEGIEPDQETLQLLEQLDNGELSMEAFIAEAIKRATNNE